MRGHRRDLTLNRNFVEEEREAMLTSLHDHIFLSTQEQDKCAEIGSSGFMSPTAISPFSKAIAGVLFSRSKPPTERTTTFNSSFESLPIKIYESSLFT